MFGEPTPCFSVPTSGWHTKISLTVPPHPNRQDCAYALLSDSPPPESLHHPEALAVEAALAIAVDEAVARKKHKITRVTVFSDARLQLQAIGAAGPDSFTRGTSSWRELKNMGVAVELRWVPGHVDVEGNERADRMANLARRFGPDPSAALTEKRAGEPVVMRLPVPMLNMVDGMLKAVTGMAGACDFVKGLALLMEDEIGCGMARVAKEEGWVIDLRKGDRFPGW
jgi:hypothetical protein